MDRLINPPLLLLAQQGACWSWKVLGKYSPLPNPPLQAGEGAGRAG
jgi:hypothetical protein